ncbi:MAG: hypothetical protein II008_00970 [Oscillospiraceae bacterium]|nr:hypothetical protein [Oscillospiraceae bacterium]
MSDDIYKVKQIQVKLGRKYDEEPRLHKMMRGELFSLSIYGFSEEKALWNNPDFQIVGIEKAKIHKYYRIFDRFYRSPFYKWTWILRICYDPNKGSET